MTRDDTLISFTLPRELAEAHGAELLSPHQYAERTGNGSPAGTRSVAYFAQDRDLRWGKREDLHRSYSQWLPALHVLDSYGGALFLRW